MPVDHLMTMEGINSTHFVLADEDPRLRQDLAESGIPSSLTAFVRGGSVALLGSLFLGEAVDPGQARAIYIREPDTGLDR
jgi:hypothetical protein